LAYNAARKLHLGGYPEFWTANQEKIEADAKRLSNVRPKRVKEPKNRLKGGPKEYYFGHNDERKVDCKTWLDELLQSKVKIDLEQFQDAAAYDPSELQRLILETELRICVTEDSRSKLQKRCERAYGLNAGLFQTMQLVSQKETGLEAI